MATQIKVWEITNGKLTSHDDMSFADSHSEAELEEWLCKGPDLLGEKLLVIARGSGTGGWADRIKRVLGFCARRVGLNPATGVGAR